MQGETGAEISDYFGVEAKNTLMAIKATGEQEVDKYLYTGAWDQKDVQTWVQTFLDDGLEKHFKSEEIPTNDTGAVKTLVGKNYEEIVHNPKAHVLVDFYAPWCDHCKKVR